MPLLRKKDKDKTNLINLGNSRAGESRAVKARPKSTGAAINVSGASGGKPTRPVSLTEVTLVPSKAATTITATATKVATDAAKIDATTTKSLAKELQSNEGNKRAATTAQTEALLIDKTAEAMQAKCKETVMAPKTADPMLTSVFGALPNVGAGKEDVSNLMTASVYGQFAGIRVTADPMLTSVFGQLPAGKVADGAALNIANGGSGSGGGVDVGGGVGVGLVGGAGGGVDVTAVKTVEPVMAKNLTLTGLTVPYTRDHKKFGESE